MTLIAYALSGQYQFLPLVHNWVLKALVEDYAEYAKKDLSKVLKVASDGRGDWVRSHEETWRSVGPWDRRAIIAAGAVLPPDERSHWKKIVLASDDPLDRAVGLSVFDRWPSRHRDSTARIWCACAP
jgi:hypothetical protein